MSLLALTWPLIAIVVSTTALIVGYLNYRRKSSINVRGCANVTSSVECPDLYVSSVVLENMKDRAMTIYGIYFLVGHNFLIEIDEFSNEPLILRPFETISREYGPIEFYSVNTHRLVMSRLFNDERACRRLVLSTNAGRYVVRRFPRQWNPVADHFRNHALALVRPVRAMYKESSIGGNIQYVLDIVLSDGKSEIVMLRSEDWSVQRFKTFRLSKESLGSAQALQEYLDARQSDGSLVCQSFQVFDAQAWRTRARTFYSGEPIEAKYIGFFQFHLLARLATVARDRAMRSKNLEAAKARSKWLGDAQS